jgi:rhamnose transport system permease protein
MRWPPAGCCGIVSDCCSRLNPQALRVLALLVVRGGGRVFFGSRSTNYLNARLFNRISTSVAIIALIAVAQALVIITRNIDLSIGSTVGFVAYRDRRPRAPTTPDLTRWSRGLAMALGAMFGASTGCSSPIARMPAIIVTLGTLALFRSLLVEYSTAKSITTANAARMAGGFPR